MARSGVVPRAVLVQHYVTYCQLVSQDFFSRSEPHSVDALPQWPAHRNFIELAIVISLWCERHVLTIYFDLQRRN